VNLAAEAGALGMRRGELAIQNPDARVNTYADNIAYRNLQVDTDVPVHGRVVPMTQVFQDIRRMTKGAEDVCADSVGGRLHTGMSCEDTGTGAVMTALKALVLFLPA